MTPGRRPSPEILARRLTRSFAVRRWRGLRARRRLAVRRLDLAVASGEVVALVGENGSGKTTTLRLLVGLLTPDSGEALIAGRPSALAAARRRLGYAPEEDEFPAGLDALGVLRLHAGLAGLRGAAGRNAARQASSDFGLDQWLSRRVSSCSRGVRRRVSLACATLGRPRALVLDEPFTGLDPVARESAFAAVRDAAEGGAAVLLSLHDERAVEALADRVVAIRRGEVVATGSVDEVRRRSASGGAWLAGLLAAREAEPGAAG